MTSLSAESLAAAFIIMEEGAGKQNQDGLYIPFQDSGDVWTIGIGHTSGVTENTPPADQDQVNSWFAQDQALLFTKVGQLPILEAVAWIDFGFNCGMAAMMACMIAGVDHIQYYVHDSKGNVQPGLVTRRAREYFLILLSRQMNS